MKKIFTSTFVVLSVVACSTDEPIPPVSEVQIVRLNAGMPQAEARAGYDGVASIWIAGDEVGVGLDATNTNLRFTQQTGSLSTDAASVVYEGTLKSPVTGNVECVAYYPYSPSATISGKSVTTTFPATQSYTSAGFRGIPLFGTYSGDINGLGIRFKNLYSVVKLTLTKDASITDAVLLQSIVFKGNTNESISGAMTVNFSDATPVVTHLGSGKTITLDCGVGVELTSSPKNFYIAVPAINYVAGYSLTFMTDKGQVTRKAKSLGADYAVNTIYATPALAIKNLVTPFIMTDEKLRNALSALGLIDVLDPVSGSVAVTALGLTATSINLSGKELSVVTGLSHFPALTALNVSNNSLSSLDVSHNLLLIALNCSNNNLTTLNISGLELLVTLNMVSGVNSIALTKLTIPAMATIKNFVSDATKWVTFECKNNPNILTITLKNNSLLTGVMVTGNTSLTSLNTTGSVLLTPLGITTSGNALGFQVIR